MKRIHNSRFEKAFLHIKNNVVIDVNGSFENLTGYCRNELIGKTISILNKMLRIDAQIKIENIVNSYNGYIFNKKLEPKYVTIACEKRAERDKIYYFKNIKHFKIVELPYKMSPLLSNEVGVGAYSITHGVLLRYNRKYLEYINKKGIFVGENFKKVLPKSINTDFEGLFMDIMNTGKSVFLNENTYKNSNKFWGESFVSIHIKGEEKFIIHTVLDITDRINNRNIIEEQNQKLNAIIENTCEEILIIDNKGNFINVNKIARDNAKVKTIKEYENFCKNSKFNYFNGNSIVPEDLPIKKVIKGENIRNFIIEISNNNATQYKEVNGTPIYDSNGNFVTGVISMRDITDTLNNAEVKLISTQYDLLNGIINNFGLGFLRFSYPDFKIIECNNKVYTDIIGSNSEFPSSYVKGKIFNKLFSENPHVIFEEFMKSVADNKSIRNLNMKVGKKGDNRTLKMVFQPLLGFDGQVIEIVVLTVDITEEVKDKEKMEKVLKIQDEIYANVSHELKTPISVIYSANQMMDMYLRNNKLEEYKEKILDYNNIIKQNSYRLTKLVNNIVDLAKGNSGFLEMNLNNVNIVEVVENIVHSVKEYVKLKDLSIIFDTDIKEKIIACDSIKIERVMLNLISNSIKFSKPKGRIYINISDKGDVVEISVKDEGTGIKRKHLDYIFQRFYQADKSLSRNAEGTGIGLSLVKKLVELHGGNISVESEVGKGSLFRVELPAKTIENPEFDEKINYVNNRIEMVNIEFSDIYSIY
ncbi:MAG: ATP-binding protein [Sedimentibacter sp.]